MFLVVALHINTVGGALEGSAAGSAQWWIADFVQIAAYCCVDCFALATGFLMAERGFRPGRIVSLWLQVAFYSVVTAAAWYFIVPGRIGLRYIASSFFPALTSKYWYFTAYFVLFFFTPFLNALLRALDARGRKMLLAALLVFFSLLPTFRPLNVIPLSGGYCFFWLAALYLIGGCVKLDRLYECASGKFFVLTYFSSAAVMLLWQLLFGADNVRLISYLSPTVLVCSAALLCAFCRMRVPDKLTGRRKIFEHNFLRCVSYPYKPLYTEHVLCRRLCLHRQNERMARAPVRARLRIGDIRCVYADRVPAAKAVCDLRYR